MFTLGLRSQGLPPAKSNQEVVLYTFHLFNRGSKDSSTLIVHFPGRKKTRGKKNNKGAEDAEAGSGNFEVAAVDSFTSQSLAEKLTISSFFINF